MAPVAITEQQISLSAAHAIRARLVERFGTAVGTGWAFPDARALAGASEQQLRACGLSHQKARYTSPLAQDVVAGRIDLDAIAAMSEDEACEALVQIRGFGPWSAEYMLVRGMARTDRVPFDDLGVRDVVGRPLGDGERVSAAKARQLLAPFAPYRSLAAFYLLVADRAQDGSGSAASVPKPARRG